jgi:hypothetical protein
MTVIHTQFAALSPIAIAIAIAIAFFLFSFFFFFAISYLFLFFVFVHLSNYIIIVFASPFISHFSLLHVFFSFLPISPNFPLLFNFLLLFFICLAVSSN